MGTWTIYKSSRLEPLLGALVHRLRSEPFAPLSPETIVVQGQGMARWLERELARQLGIAGSFRFPYPGAFLRSLLPAQAPEPGPFSREALDLRIFRLLDDPALRPRLGAAARYCEDDPQHRKQSQLAAALAQRFDDYQLYRPDLLRAFATGQTVDLPHADWQGVLWRALLEERPGHDDARRIDALLERLQHGKPDQLPERITLFALPTLPKAVVDVLRATEAYADIAQYALLPSLGFLEDQRLHADADADLPSPLVAALGRQSRELFAQLQDLEDVEPARPSIELDAEPAPARSLLSFVQQDVLELCAPADGKAERQLDPHDDSLRVHSAHSPLREMEILRDQLLDFFASDPSLRPQDALILVPDVREYGPLVEAAFAPVRHLLQPHIADRSPQGESRAPALAMRLFALAGSRYSVFDLMPLLDEPAVAARFGIAPAQTQAAHELLEQARVRWGIDGEHRKQRFGVPQDDANSWRLGLRRLLLGIATGPIDDLALGLLPQADETMARSSLLSSLLEFFQAVHECADSFCEPGSLLAWAVRIERALQRLFLPQSDEDRRGLSEAHKALRRLRELASAAGEDERPTLLPPIAVQQRLQALFDESADGRGFLFGSLNIAALRPMRAVPVRILALAGLHDGSFPRTQTRHEFDLMAERRRPGDPDRRIEDRQLFLDALMAAREKLVLTYVGRSSKDNSERAPSPVLAELLDCLDQTATAPDGRAVRDHVVVDHPLQSWSPRYGGADLRLFTFAGASKGRPLSELGQDAQSPAAEAPPTAKERIAIEDLAAFWTNPPLAAARAMGLAFPKDSSDAETDDSEPFATGTLERHMLLQREVRRRLRSQATDPQHDEQRILQTGLLPSGHLGRLEAPDLLAAAETLFQKVQSHGPLRDLHIEVQGLDYIVHGDLDGVAQDARVEWSAGAWSPVKLLAPFVRHVAMAASVAQGAKAPSRTILRSLDRDVELGAVDDALSLLDLLVAGRRDGQRRALPTPRNAAMAAAKALHVGAKAGDPEKAQRLALAKAEDAYEKPDFDADRFGHDLPDPALEFLFRDRSPIEDPEFLKWVKLVHAQLLAICSDVEAEE